MEEVSIIIQVMLPDGKMKVNEMACSLEQYKDTQALLENIIKPAIYALQESK